MAISALVVALGSTLLDVLAKKALDETLKIAIAPIVSNAKNKIEQELKLGKYAAIERALKQARKEVLAQCRTSEQRRSVNQVIDTLMQTKASQLLDEFGAQVTQTYLLPAPNVASTKTLAHTYRRMNDLSAVLNDEVPTETALTTLFDAFFSSYRENLLREPDFTYLREYFQLVEGRQQTRLQESILEQVIAIAANTSHPVEDFTRVSREYRETLVQELKNHVIRGFSPHVSGRVLSLPLDKIFLPLQAVEGRPALAEYAEEDLRRQAMHETMGELDWQRRREEMEKRYAQLSARQASQKPLNLAELLRHPRAVLLGDPGTGKTTVTRYITYALAAGDPVHVGDEVLHLMPVLVRIANYAKAFERDTTLHFIEYIERELRSKPEHGHYLRYAIEHGECLVILDGLDEVTDPALRMQVTDRIRGMVADFGDNQFLVTSRIIGYDAAPLPGEFKHATLREMGVSDRERFIHLWYDAIAAELPESIHAEGADDLIEALRAKPQIARVGANPLLLTIMVLMHWRGAKLPSHRVKVYQNATDTLVEYWTKQRQVDLDAEDVKNILAPIAYYILSSNVAGVIAHNDLLPRFFDGIMKQRGCTLPEAKRLGKEMLHDLNEQSGLFLERGRDTDDQPVYGFLHQTFGEYLAALELAQQMLRGEFALENYIHRSVWYEPLLLMAGHLSIVSPKHADDLLRQILDYPALHEEVLHRNPLLAANCLGDDIQVDPKLRDEVLEKLTQLLEDGASQVYNAALELYERLVLTRHRERTLAILLRCVEKIDDPEKVSPQMRLNFSAALVYLGERDVSQRLLWALDDSSYRTPLSLVQRLRFRGWQHLALDYLLSLQEDKNNDFYISVASTLSDSIIGFFDADFVQRVLGKERTLSLIDVLISRVESESEKFQLRWLAVLVEESSSDERILPFLDEPGSPVLRRLAAERLLKGKHHLRAVGVLKGLVASEVEQAPAAMKALLGVGEVSAAEIDSLRDIALLVNHSRSAEAIVLLLQVHDYEFASGAAVLYAILSQSYSTGSGLRDITFALLSSDHFELGMAFAAELGLRAGYEYRLEMCEAMLEVGRVEQAISGLNYVACDCYGEPSQKACRKLLALKQAERVLPILRQSSSISASAALRYQACMALALADISMVGETKQSPDMRQRLYHERRSAHAVAVSVLCEESRERLSRLQHRDAKVDSILQLADCALTLFEGKRIHDDLVKQVNVLMNSPFPSTRFLAIALGLRLGQFEDGYHCLSDLCQTSSLPALLLTHAVNQIRFFANSRTLGLLIPLLESPEVDVRTSAVGALGQIGDVSAVPHLLTALSDTNVNVWSTAASVLGQIGDASAVPQLLTALSDTNVNVRSSAASVLGQIGDASAVPQ
ncbi:MAG: HEAT repeat domain-containing protein, partial [Chloroflexi bacterium]|nr:HEAT repeat domain-containing protein [Chloroflexota bacterium]